MSRTSLTFEPTSAAKSSGSFLANYWNAPASDVQNHVIVRTCDGMILLNGFQVLN